MIRILSTLSVICFYSLLVLGCSESDSHADKLVRHITELSRNVETSHVVERTDSHGNLEHLSVNDLNASNRYFVENQKEIENLLGILRSKLRSNASDDSLPVIMFLSLFLVDYSTINKLDSLDQDYAVELYAFSGFIKV